MRHNAPLPRVLLAATLTVLAGCNMTSGSGLFSTADGSSSATSSTSSQVNSSAGSLGALSKPRPAYARKS